MLRPEPKKYSGPSAPRYVQCCRRRPEIEHIGATAVPGCITKGDLDIVVRVDAEDFSEADRVLASRYGRNEASAKTDAFASFECEVSDPPTGIQLVSKGSPLDDFLPFRDLLRQDDQLVRAYNDLKQGAAHLGRDGYWQAKNMFISQVLRDRRNSEIGKSG
jgi:GrpB-like predicted nucleotidyltransferase (UPF0157 family)